MDHATHERIAKWERRWLAASGLMSLTFVILIAYTLATEGGEIVQAAGRTDPATLTTSALFAQPGVRALGPNEYQVSLIGQAFTWVPNTVVVPVGALVRFYFTSRDVIHGYQVERTSINLEVIPGEVATLHYTFDEPGTYRVSCNQYCGSLHHEMVGWVEVVSAAEFARRQSAQAAPAEVDGAAVFASNCASCHQANGQGIAGAFPPVAGHLPDLVRADRTYPVKLLLNGLQGAITVNGTSYNGQMPAWSHLSDEELAAVLNYAVTAWDEPEALPADFVPYTADEFAAERQSPLSAAEMLALRGELELP